MFPSQKFLKMNFSRFSGLEYYRLVLRSCSDSIDCVFGIDYSIALTKQNFTLRYDTNIPRQVVRIPLSALTKMHLTVHNAHCETCLC